MIFKEAVYFDCFFFVSKYVLRNIKQCKMVFVAKG